MSLYMQHADLSPTIKNGSQEFQISICKEVCTIMNEQTKAHVRLITAIGYKRMIIRHPLERNRERSIKHLFIHVRKQSFDHPLDHLLINKRHLYIKLSEFWLP